MGLMNDLAGLSAAYASMNQSDQGYLLTRADKDGNTPAWQNRYKINEATGKPLYIMADHLVESFENELFHKIDEALEELDKLNEGKIPAGLRAYLDKKKGKKGNGKDNGNGKDHDDDNGNGNGKGKPDFIDLDKDGDKKESMKKAAKDKKMKEEYVDEMVKGADPVMRKMASQDRQQGKDKLLSKKKGQTNAAHMMTKIKMSPGYGEETNIVQKLIDSGRFTESEIRGILES